MGPSAGERLTECVRVVQRPSAHTDMIDIYMVVVCWQDYSMYSWIVCHVHSCASLKWNSRLLMRGTRYPPVCMYYTLPNCTTYTETQTVLQRQKGHKGKKGTTPLSGGVPKVVYANLMRSSVSSSRLMARSEGL